jgi:signal transduction histidine kinase/DNA-binding response OmpR family regulator
MGTEKRIANYASRFGVILNGILCFIEDLYRTDYDGQGVEILVLSVISAVFLAVIQTLLRNNKYLPLVTGITITIFFLSGEITYKPGFNYYFITMLCIVGVVTLYQHFASVALFFVFTLCLNIPLYFTIFKNPDYADYRETLIRGILFFYGFFYLMFLSYRLSVKNTLSKNAQDAFSSLLATTPNMMVIVDDMRKVTFISEQMAKFADCPAKYAVGRPVLDLFIDYEIKLMFADIIEIIDTDGYFEDIRKIEINETPHYFKIVCDRLQGETEGMFIDVADVTATVEAKLEAEIEKENAIEANLSKSKFLATMSHEIRTPMNAIIGISQMQMGRTDIPKDSLDAIGKIYTSGHGLLGIINDILDLSKIETGKLELISAEYDIPSLLNDAVQLNITRIGSKPIEFCLNVSEDVPAKLIGDELRIKQILNNILSNAIKYTDEGFVSMNVNRSKTDNGINLIISISDTGQGMRKEDAEALGEEFARFNLEANRSTEGTGLGMSITKRLIKLMDGTLEIQSEFGVGSTFTVSIPQKVKTDKIIGLELAAKLKNFTFSQDKQAEKLQIIREYMPYGKVLVVDDVETNLYVAEGLIKPYGITVETVTSGFGAIDLVKSGNTYDIIFMDHMMPRMDGIETTERLRSMGYRAPIVALTANALAGNDVLFKSKGFDDFISKPIDIRQLNAALNHYVRDKNKSVNSHSVNNVIPVLSASEDNISPKLIEAFTRDAKKAVSVLNTDAKTFDLKLFTTTAHAMKSACANVGNAELSELAKLLETAGRDNDISYINENTASFVAELDNFIKKLNPNNDDKENLTENTALLYETLGAIADACSNYDDSLADKLLSSLGTYKWSDETAALISQIGSHLLHAEFEEAEEAARRAIN